MMPKLDDHACIKDTVACLEVSQNTLRAWAASGKVPVTRNPVNGYRLFRRSDLEQLLQEISESFDKRRHRKPR